MKTQSVCPKCKTVLEFERAGRSTVKCPKCGYEGNVANFKEMEPPTETPLGKGKIYKPGKLELLETDAKWLQPERTFSLKRGINTLGRMSPISTSSIQFPTEDSFMSKDHATIDVIMKSDSVFEHRLSDKNSKNGTFHSKGGIVSKDDRLEKGEVTILMQGDIIKMGHTYFKFIVE